MSASVRATVDHGEAIEAACELDRDYARRHPHARSYIRVALAHELCPPTGPCVPAERVLVTFWASGLRSRLQVAP